MEKDIPMSAREALELKFVDEITAAEEAESFSPLAEIMDDKCFKCRFLV
jgi:hypothetical protein